MLSERRKEAHSRHLEDLRRQAYYAYNSEPHPSQIAHAQSVLKRGIDEDWQTSVQRYPEVLEYFFSLVELTLPDESEPSVKDPPLSALSGGRKFGRRHAPEPIAPGPFHAPIDAVPPRHAPIDAMPPRHTITPPPPTQGMSMGMGRRTPGPPGPPGPPRRAERRGLRPPAPPPSFYAGPGHHWPN